MRFLAQLIFMSCIARLKQLPEILVCRCPGSAIQGSIACTHRKQGVIKKVVSATVERNSKLPRFGSKKHRVFSVG